MKILLRLVIIGLVVGGGVLFRDRLSGNAGELAIGDCFDVPTTATSVSDVQHHPCNETHTGEVFFVGELPAAKGVAFSEAMLDDYLGTTCIPVFKTYTGTSTYTGLDIGAFYPLQKDWDAGERSVTCYLYEVDGSSMSKSLKAA